jgi:hypothetical protein
MKSYVWQEYIHYGYQSPLRTLVSQPFLETGRYIDLVRENAIT